MGVETVILPTAVLSTHTMFKGFTVKDLTDQLRPITAHWKAEGIHFDAIYTDAPEDLVSPLKALPGVTVISSAQD